MDECRSSSITTVTVLMLTSITTVLSSPTTCSIWALSAIFKCSVPSANETLFQQRDHLRSLISKWKIFKNTKIELTLNSYMKFNVESVPSVHSSQNSFHPPPKNEFKFCTLNQNAISPAKFTSKRNNSRCCPKNRSIHIFFCNKPILQLECTNPRMFLPLYSVKKTGNIYCRVTQCYHLQFPCFGIQYTEFCYQPLVSNLNIAFWCSADVLIDFKCG